MVVRCGMIRLTTTSDKGGVAFTFDLDITCKPSEAQKILRLAEKLKHYEDLEDKGRLIELPCAVGDTIYNPETGKPFDKVIQFVIDENGVHCKTLSVMAEMEGAE